MFVGHRVEPFPPGSSRHWWPEMTPQWHGVLLPAHCTTSIPFPGDGANGLWSGKSGNWCTRRGENGQSLVVTNPRTDCERDHRPTESHDEYSPRRIAPGSVPGRRQQCVCGPRSPTCGSSFCHLPTDSSPSSGCGGCSPGNIPGTRAPSGGCVAAGSGRLLALWGGAASGA